MDKAAELKRKRAVWVERYVGENPDASVNDIGKAANREGYGIFPDTISRIRTSVLMRISNEPVIHKKEAAPDVITQPIALDSFTAFKARQEAPVSPPSARPLWQEAADRIFREHPEYAIDMICTEVRKAGIGGVRAAVMRDYVRDLRESSASARTLAWQNFVDDYVIANPTVTIRDLRNLLREKGFKAKTEVMEEYIKEARAVVNPTPIPRRAAFAKAAAAAVRVDSVVASPPKQKSTVMSRMLSLEFEPWHDMVDRWVADESVSSVNAMVRQLQQDGFRRNSNVFWAYGKWAVAQGVEAAQARITARAQEKHAAPAPSAPSVLEAVLASAKPPPAPHGEMLEMILKLTMANAENLAALRQQVATLAEKLR